MRSPRPSAPARTWASTSGRPASICRASIAGRTRASCPPRYRCPTGTFPARSRSASTIATSARCSPGAPSISATSSSASSSFSPSTRRSRNGTRSGSATSSSTSSRTRIPPSTRSSAGSPRCTATFAWWATTTRASTAGAAPKCRTSSISRVTSRAPRSSSWSRITVRRGASWPRPTRSSRRTSGAARRSSGPRSATARRSASPCSITSATRRAGSRRSCRRSTPAGPRTRRWPSSTGRTRSPARWKTPCARGAFRTGSCAGDRSTTAPR